MKKTIATIAMLIFLGACGGSSSKESSNAGAIKFCEAQRDSYVSDDPVTADEVSAGTDKQRELRDRSKVAQSNNDLRGMAETLTELATICNNLGVNIRPSK